MNPYPWGELDQYPIPTIHPGVTRRNDGNERNEIKLSPVVGGSPPPKLEPATKNFHDDRNQRVPQTNRTASYDLAFKAGKRTDGIMTHNARHHILIHPNQFDALSADNLPYNDFFPGTDTEDEEYKAEPCTPAQPKTPKRKHKNSSRRRSRKSTKSEKDGDLTDE